MAPDIANLVTCSVEGHTFDTLVDEHGRYLCMKCGTVETPPEADDEPDEDDTAIYTETGGEG